MPRRRSDENLRLVAERRWQFWRRRAGQPTEFDEDEGPYHDVADRDPGAAQSLTRSLRGTVAGGELNPNRQTREDRRSGFNRVITTGHSKRRHFPPLALGPAFP